MIHKSAWFVVLLMVAVAASPAVASGIPAGTTMMPMHPGSTPVASQSPGCNCQPMQAAAAAARGEPLPRAAAGPEASPCNGTAVPVVSVTPGTTGRVSGIRRIYPKNVLDHPERAAIYTAVVARPGIDLAGIASELDMNRETLRYHLDQLESATRIVVMRNHGIVRYYENHGRYTPMERMVLQHLWNPTAARILSLISTVPGIPQAGIAGCLGITAPTVRWYVQRFEEDGLLTVHRDGRFARYMLTDTSAAFLGRTAVNNGITVPAGFPAGGIREQGAAGASPAN